MIVKSIRAGGVLSIELSRQHYNTVVEPAEAAPDDGKDGDRHDDKGEWLPAGPAAHRPVVPPLSWKSRHAMCSLLFVATPLGRY